MRYLVDPYGVFGSGWLPYSSDPNLRFLKVEHIREYPRRYTGLLFGSSRTAPFDPAVFARYRSDSRIYNFAFNTGTPDDYLMILRYCLDYGLRIKEVLIQLDPDVLTNSSRMDARSKAERYGLVYRHHPDVSGSSRLLFFLDNIFLVPHQAMLDKWRYNNSPGVPVSFDISGDGRSHFLFSERPLVADPEAYYANSDRFLKPRVTARRKASGFVSFHLAPLRELVGLARKNGIELILWIAPLNQHLMDEIDAASYLALIRELSGIHPFWNFGAYNDVTQNNRNYYERSHPRPFVGAIMASRMLGDGRGTPEGFGRLVTPERIEVEGEILATEFARRDARR
ncbi:MAG: DUF1574 family protein [Magnetococcales bacterium]|nr:DUF1574 family protein [Magnetococcales bacterium]